MSETTLKIINMQDVEAKEVKWLWYPYIPYGKITIIQGDPGEGKTTLVLNLAAKLTRGEKLPESVKAAEPINVLYQSAEDGLADTIKPLFSTRCKPISALRWICTARMRLDRCSSIFRQSPKSTAAPLS